MVDKLKQEFSISETGNSGKERMSVKEHELGKQMRHPNSIFTPEQIQQLLNSPTGNWFKRLLTGLQLAFLTAQELAKQLAVMPAQISNDGRGKSTKPRQQAAEPEKAGKADREAHWFKDFFTKLYTNLLSLTESLTDALTQHDQKVSALVEQELPAVVQTLRGLDRDQFKVMAEQHAPELRLDEETIDAAFDAHRHAFPALENERPFELKMRPGFAKALRERFGDQENISKEEACCTLVDHQIMPEVSRVSPAMQHTPAYDLLQRTYEQTVQTVHSGLLEHIVQEYNTLSRSAHQIEKEKAGINELLSKQLGSGNLTAAKIQTEILKNPELASRIESAMNGLQSAYAGVGQQQQQQAQQQVAAPRPSPSSGRRAPEEDELQQRSPYSSSLSNPFGTPRLTPGGSGSAKG